MVSHNSARLLTALFGVSGSGRILVPINFRLVAEEVRYIVEHSGAVALLIDPELADELGDIPGVKDAIAGHVAAGMNRSDLMELGEEIDIGQSALIVAAAGNISFDVEKVITRADQVFSKEVQIDPDDLAADVDEAKG